MFALDTLDRIIQASVEQPIIDQVLQVAGYASRPEPHDEFCIQFSERIARRYLAGDLSFVEADAAANWLFAYSYMTEESPGEMPALAREVFEAFDSGEYYHDGDDRGEDPEGKYTLPEIKRIVETKFDQKVNENLRR